MSDETLDRLAESFVRSWREGQRPTIEEYALRHPDLASEIRALFPALVALEKAAPEGVSEPPLSGDLGEYRIVREVGRGGMGIVYEAEQTTLHRRVALKVLPRHACRDSRLLDRFRREAQAAARLHHNNIVPVYGIGEHAGIHFYTMQFVQGQPLSRVIAELRRIRHGDAPPEGGGLLGLAGADGDRPFFHGAARLGKQVAEALAYAHGQGVIHRDIKPSNLMFDADGRVWVTDFGLARAEGASNLTRTGDMLGTLAYMAPERFRGWSDPRSDVYSLGLTLYEMLSLRPAFFETDVNRLIRRITESDLPPLRRRRRNIPRDLETVVLRATARDPADRYQTAAEMAADLGLFLADRPVRAQRASTLRRFRGWCRRNPLTAGLSALVVLLVLTILAVSGTALVLLRGERDAAIENLGRAEAAEARLIEELRSSHIAQARALRASRRPGQRLDALDLLGRAARIRPSPELRDDVITTLAQLDIRTLRHWTGAPRPQALDPKNRRLARAWPNGDITLHPIPDGEEIVRLTGDGTPPAVAAFSPDGRYLGSIHEPGYGTVLRVFDLERAAVVIEVPSCSQRGSMHFDGRGRAAVGAPDGGIVLIDLARGATKKLPGASRSPATRLRFSPDGRRLAAADGETLVRILDLKSDKEWALRFPMPVFDICWHPHADRLAVAMGNEVRIWDVAQSRLVRTMHGHQAVVSNVDYGADGSILASSGWDRRTILWDAATGEQLLALPHGSVFSDPYLLESSGSESWLSELVRSPCVATIDEDATWTEPFAVGFSPDRRMLATLSKDRVRLWDLSCMSEIATLPLRGAQLVAFPGHDALVTATPDRILRWPVTHDAGQGVVTIGPPGALFEERVPDPEGAFPTERDMRFLAALRAATGPLPLVLLERTDRPSIAVSADGRWAATRTWQAGDLHIWDLGRGERVDSLPIGNAQARFTPDGRHLLVNGLYEPCRMFETGSWRLVREFASEPSGVAVSSDGKLLAVASPPSGVALLALPDAAPLASLQTEGTLLPSSLQFNAGGDLLAVVQSQRVQLWDLARVREELERFGLEGGLPAWPPRGRAPATPLRAVVLPAAADPTKR